MKQSVQLFAKARELAGTSLVQIDLPPKARVSDLREQLQQQFPSLRSLAAHLLIAVNEEYLAEEALLPQQATIACFPPVSGG